MGSFKGNCKTPPFKDLKKKLLQILNYCHLNIDIRISRFRGLDLNSKARGFPLPFNQENKLSLIEA